MSAAFPAKLSQLEGLAMRKQDRIAGQQQGREQMQPDTTPRPEPRPGEQMKGSASTSPEPSPRPQRQGGKLPLPD